MTRWLTGALLLCASLVAAACPLCIGAYQSSAGQNLVELRRAVLALPAADGMGYRVVDLIKGDRPPSDIIAADAVQLKVALTGNPSPLLLVSDDGWSMWVNGGAIDRRYATWLRQVATGKRATETNADEWRARVATALPYLENPEPLAAEIAYGELAAAPYAALLTVKPRLEVRAIREWLANPALTARRPLYLLLQGIAGDATDAARLERQLETAWQSRDVINLGSMLAADLQLRGAARVAWVDERYLRDRTRSMPEIEAALLALSVQGNADSAIPRERVIRSYRMFIQEHKEIAGFVAQDLAAWHYWDAVPEYLALMKSDLRQQYASRVAIVAYLKQSPGGAAGLDFK